MSKPIKNLKLFNDLCAVEETLIERGWCKGKVKDVDGRVCLMGAAAQLCGVASGYDIEEKKDYRRYHNIINAIATTIYKGPARIFHNVDTIASFNDNPNTTIDDVRGKLREAREALL